MIRLGGPSGPRWVVMGVQILLFGKVDLYGLAFSKSRKEVHKLDTITYQPIFLSLCNPQQQAAFDNFAIPSRQQKQKQKPTMEKVRISAESDDQTASSELQPKQLQRRNKKKGKASRRKRRQSSGPLDQLPVGGDVGNPLNGVTNTLGSVANNAVDEHQGGDGRKSDTLRLRLDLNLDIEIQLKARIHGDLELALLYVTLPSPGKNSHPTSVLWPSYLP